jgi:hypothetical protein
MSKDFSGLPGVLTVAAVSGVKHSSPSGQTTGAAPAVFIDNRQGTRIPAAHADARPNLIFIAPSPILKLILYINPSAFVCNHSATVRGIAFGIL